MEDHHKLLNNNCVLKWSWNLYLLSGGWNLNPKGRWPYLWIVRVEQLDATEWVRRGGIISLYGFTLYCAAHPQLTSSNEWPANDFILKVNKMLKQDWINHLRFSIIGLSEPESTVLTKQYVYKCVQHVIAATAIGLVADRKIKKSQFYGN